MPFDGSKRIGVGRVLCFGRIAYRSRLRVIGLVSPLAVVADYQFCRWWGDNVLGCDFVGCVGYGLGRGRYTWHLIDGARQMAVVGDT